MFRNLLFTYLLISVNLFVAAGPTAADDKSPIDFNRDIRPILSGHCFKCHGPDDKTREGELRLDVFDAAVEDRGGSAAIRPGHPEASSIIERISSSDADLVMPPPTENKTISPAQLDTLKRWIASGAQYEPHWAFEKPVKAPLPVVSQEQWCTNPIDRFVLARLDAAGLPPSPKADRYTLVRRVYLDLIGLPPTIEEADAFVDDTAPDAYERLVDRLLASPHYGERWARRWLDVARYADTNGYEKDRPRSIWPYRDWVIQAINDGMPYDQFVIKQFAGDMLGSEGEARINDLVATGFHRNTMVNEEGGADPLEYRFHAMVDRVNTTGTALFGLTVGCTQCHTHKYDPITQTEYYGLMAFLNNADEPELELPDDQASQQRRAKLDEAERLASRRLEEWRLKSASQTSNEANSNETSGSETSASATAQADDAAVEKAFDAWLAQSQRELAEWTVVVPTRREANLARFDLMPDGSLFAQGDVSKEDKYNFTLLVPAGTTAIRIEALPDERLPSNGPGRAYYEGPSGDFMLADLVASHDGEELEFSGASASYNGVGFGKTAAVEGAIDEDKHTGWSIGGRPGERHVAVFKFAEPIADAGAIDLNMLFFRHFAAPLGRFRLAVTKAPTPKATILSDEVQALLLSDRESWTKDEQQIAKDAWLSVAEELAEYNTKIADIYRTLPKGPTTLVMRERPANHSRETRRHHRGEYVNPEEVVQPRIPEALGSWPSDRPKNRLEFARWAVSEANPLAARVKVNRDWAAIFGTGLVKTLDDFGSQGELPSHPELLDWLSVELVESGWDLKALHRLIVTSSTYRQDSGASDKAREIDPENRLLSHGSRKRLPAELVRDAILTASGLLTRTVGGPSVFPPQPEVVARENFYAKFEWKTETGPDRYRRGMYTFAKRTNPYAMFTTFDAPTGTVCVARRERSNTPLQALTLLNDTVITEAARSLGTAAASLEGDTNDRIVWLFRQCLTRPPTEAEANALASFYERQHQRFLADKAATDALMENQNATAEQASSMLVARALLNTDEMIVKR